MFIKIILALLATLSWVCLSPTLEWTCVAHNYDNIPAWLYALFGTADFLPGGDEKQAYAKFQQAIAQGLHRQIVGSIGLVGVFFLTFHVWRLCRCRDWHKRRSILIYSIACALPWALICAFGCHETFVSNASWPKRVENNQLSADPRP